MDVLLGKPRNGWSAPCDGLDTGTAVLSLGAVTGHTYRPAHHKWTSSPTHTEAHYWLNEGDLLITRSNTPELVGHAAIYSGQPYPCIYPDLMMRLDVDMQKADKRFVHYWLQSAAARAHIQSKAKGTSPTMRKISQEVVMTIPFPSSIQKARQAQIADWLDKLKAKATSALCLKREAAESLASLMPALLNATFSPARSDTEANDETAPRKQALEKALESAP